MIIIKSMVSFGRAIVVASRPGSAIYYKEESCWIVDRESCWIETSLILLNSMFNKILINSVCDWCFPLTDLSPVCIVLSYCTVLNCSIILDYHCIETLRTILACIQVFSRTKV